MTRKGCDGAYLRQCIEQAGWTPAELARRLEVSPQNVSHWLAGTRDVPLGALHKIVELGLPWDPVKLSAQAFEFHNVELKYQSNVEGVKK